MSQSMMLMRGVGLCVSNGLSAKLLTCPPMHGQYGANSYKIHLLEKFAQPTYIANSHAYFEREKVDKELWPSLYLMLLCLKAMLNFNGCIGYLWTKLHLANWMLKQKVSRGSLETKNVFVGGHWQAPTTVWFISFRPRGSLRRQPIVWVSILD